MDNSGVGKRDAKVDKDDPQIGKDNSTTGKARPRPCNDQFNHIIGTFNNDTSTEVHRVGATHGRSHSHSAPAMGLRRGLRQLGEVLDR